MSEEPVAEKLRQAREQQGKTYEQIQRQTGLSLNVLQAMESGNFKVVEPVYVRMILRAYAEYLGLDGADIVQQYNRQFGAPFPTLKTPTPTPPPQVPPGEGGETAAPAVLPPWQSALGPARDLYPPRGQSRAWLFALAGIGLVLLMSLVYWLNQEEEPPYVERPASQAQPRTPALPQRSLQPPPEGQPPAGTAAVPGAVSAVDTAAPRSPVPPAALAEPAAPGPRPESAVPAGTLVLEFEAIEPTWVRVRWDQGGFFESMLQPGATRRLEAREHFLVWAGNSRGLRYRFQGQPIEQSRLGDPNRTVRFRATTEGLRLLDKEEFEKLSEDTRVRDTTAGARRDSVP